MSGEVFVIHHEQRQQGDREFPYTSYLAQIYRPSLLAYHCEQKAGRQPARRAGCRFLSSYRRSIPQRYYQHSPGFYI